MTDAYNSNHWFYTLTELSWRNICLFRKETKQHETRDDEKLKPPKEVQKSSCLQAIKITALKLHDCLFSMHHCTCHRLFVFSPTHMVDESTLLELLYSSLCLLHTYLNLPFSPPTNTHINFQTATTGCVSE